MSQLFRLSGAVQRDPEVDAWFSGVVPIAGRGLLLSIHSYGRSHLGLLSFAGRWLSPLQPTGRYSLSPSSLTRSGSYFLSGWGAFRFVDLQRGPGPAFRLPDGRSLIPGGRWCSWMLLDGPDPVTALLECNVRSTSPLGGTRHLRLVTFRRPEVSLAGPSGRR